MACILAETAFFIGKNDILRRRHSTAGLPIRYVREEPFTSWIAHSGYQKQVLSNNNAVIS